MTGLPRSIIRKYGVTKKAWSVFRSSHSSTRKRVRSSDNMTRKRSRASSVVHRARRRVHSFTASRSGPASITEIAFSGAYGYFRSDVVGFAQPVISMVPAGDYSDNVTLGLGAYAISYLLKPSNAYVKQGLRTIVLSEAFVAGAKARAGASITTSNSQSVANSDYL